jgi:hypothetical protein
MPTVTLDKIEYRELQKKAKVYDSFWGQEVKIKRMIPVIYLQGKSAKKLDRRVEQSLREYRAGKTVKIKSVADLM